MATNSRKTVDEFIAHLRRRLKAMDEGDLPAGRNYEDAMRAIEMAERFARRPN